MLLGDEIPLEVKIVSVYSYGFVVSWIPFNTTDLDHRKFLGYQAQYLITLFLYYLMFLDILQESMFYLSI